RPHNKPLSDEQLAYWNVWLNPPTLSPNMIRFFDQYVHDSRAGFLRIDGSGYLKPRQIIDVEGASVATAQSGTTQPSGSMAETSPEAATA
ncbi:DUF2235 domain-containing protein, partial [Paraburkholderia sp. CNPSo 3272]|nr:DUF2235 domain-containing protein [Paraburkholderia sp. CNPSo 3272]